MKALVVIFSIFPLGLSALPQIPDPREEPDAFQIVISEIMADPTPPVRLPGLEYIELFNRGSFMVDLEGWQLVMGDHCRVLQGMEIAPGGYLILCKSGSEGAFQPYGKTLPVSAMPAVVNTGQTLTLRSVSGKVVHSVTFSPDWYPSAEKAEGGWSLEIIDPDNPCSSDENWTASSDPRGGTPGTRNSVDAENPDIHPPRLLRATLPSDSTVMLLFNERLDDAGMRSPELYSANHGLFHPIKADPAEPEYQSVLLSYPRSFDPKLCYTLTVLPVLRDCAGHPLAGNNQVEFAIPGAVSPADILLNEILFDPHPGESEFIECYNRSDKVLDLSDLSINLNDPWTGRITSAVALSEYPFLLFPGCFAVITRKASQLPNHCYTKNPGVILEIPDLFTFPDTEGMIMLTNPLSGTIDALHYTKDMHAGVLHRLEGVSLERTDSENPADRPENWYSASTAAGYCTPGAPNSQMVQPIEAGMEILLEPDLFSPDGDGLDDITTLHLRLSEPSNWATIMVLDRHGNRVRDIALRVLLGTEEYFPWDGTKQDNSRAEVGIYLIYVEIISKTGHVKNIMKVVTLTRKI
jgi:hypothetical protein